MGWTDLSAAFGYGTKLTSQQMQQLRDNIAAAMEGASGAPQAEIAGDNNYFASGDLGGSSIGISGLSYADHVGITFLRGGTFRFYWGYRNETNNFTSYFRITVNDVVEVGPVQDTGTSGGDPFHYRTDDITVEAGDILVFEAYNENNTYPGEMVIYMRGEYVSGSFVNALDF